MSHECIYPGCKLLGEGLFPVPYCEDHESEHGDDWTFCGHLDSECWNWASRVNNPGFCCVLHGGVDFTQHLKQTEGKQEPPMDNFQLHLKDRSQENFNTAIRILMVQTQSKATHYASHPKNGVVLFWAKPEMEQFAVPGMDCTFQGDQTGKDPEIDFRVPVQKLPFPLTSESAPAFLWGFLESMTYPPKPTNDGDSVKGFHIYSGNHYGQIGDSRYTILQVAPLWGLIGK